MYVGDCRKDSSRYRTLMYGESLGSSSAVFRLYVVSVGVFAGPASAARGAETEGQGQPWRGGSTSSHPHSAATKWRHVMSYDVMQVDFHCLSKPLANHLVSVLVIFCAQYCLDSTLLTVSCTL